MTDAPPHAAARRPRVFYGWWIVAASVLTNAILTGSVFVGFSAFIIPIEQTFGWGRSVISAAFSLRQLESGLAAPFLGFLVDRYGARVFIIGGAVVTGLGLIALGLLSSNIFTFYLFFIIVAIGTSGVSHSVTWPIVIARWFRRNRGKAIGIAVIGPTIGGPLVILNQAVEDQFGWRTVIAAHGVVVLVLVSLLGLVARERPEPYGLRPDGDAAPEAGADAAGAARAEQERGLRFAEVVRLPAFWLLTIYLGGMFVGSSGLLTHELPYFEQDKGFSTLAASVMVALTFGVSAIGRIGGGAMLDRVDYRVVMAGAALAMAVSFVYLQVVTIDSWPMALPFVVLFGVAFGTNIPMRATLPSLMFGNRSLGALVGVINGSTVMAGLAGPLMLGVVFDLQGSYSTGLWAMAALSLVLAAPAFFMRPRAEMERALR